MRTLLGHGLLLALAAATVGCQHHLFFEEASHAGLLIEFDSTGTVPVNVDVGVEREVIALIPQRLDGDKETNNGDIKLVEPEDLEDDPYLKGRVEKLNSAGIDVLAYSPHHGELTSLYTTFEANVGLLDPFEVRHLLATGTAAANLVANPDALSKLDKSR